jgi:hypothetical protein
MQRHCIISAEGRGSNPGSSNLFILKDEISSHYATYFTIIMMMALYSLCCSELSVDISVSVLTVGFGHCVLRDRFVSLVFYCNGCIFYTFFFWQFGFGSYIGLCLMCFRLEKCLFYPYN